MSQEYAFNRGSLYQQEVLQNVGFHGLDQMLVKPRLVRAAAVLVLPVAGHGDQAGFGRGWVVTQPAGDPVAVQPRQPDVAEHDIRLPFFCRLDAGWSGVGDSHLIPVKFQQQAQAVGGVLVSLAKNRRRGLEYQM